MGVIKGQNLRLKIGDGATSETMKVVAAATSCTIHVSAALESSSTKDSTEGIWDEQEVTGKSWDISTDALVIIDSGEEGLTAFGALDLVGTEVTVEFGQASGANNRTITAMYSGKAIINDVSVSAQNKTNSSYTLQATGVSALAKKS